MIASRKASVKCDSYYDTIWTLLILEYFVVWVTTPAESRKSDEIGGEIILPVNAALKYVQIQCIQF
jgi:hypothetical protein